MNSPLFLLNQLIIPNRMLLTDSLKAYKSNIKKNTDII